jgi:hypothetical protein
VRWTTRLWARLLWVLDRLLGTHLVEWELARHQGKIERLVARMDQLNKDLDALSTEVNLYRLVQCLAGLKVRSGRDDLDDWLRFAPQEEDGDEALLDSAIECLVRPRLAAIDDAQNESGHYVYRLYPDWAAIIVRLEGAAVALELMPWLKEQT